MQTQIVDESIEHWHEIARSRMQRTARTYERRCCGNKVWISAQYLPAHAGRVERASEHVVHIFSTELQACAERTCERFLLSYIPLEAGVSFWHGVNGETRVANPSGMFIHGFSDLLLQSQGFVPRLLVQIRSGHHVQVLSSAGGGQGRHPTKIDAQRHLQALHASWGVSAELGIRAAVFATPT